MGTNYNKMKYPDNFIEPRIPRELDGVRDQVDNVGGKYRVGERKIAHRVAELLHTSLCDVINEKLYYSCGRLVVSKKSTWG